MATKKETKSKATRVYDESSIEHHEGLKGIRMRPTMYMGILGGAGIMHMFREVIDNCFDEAKDGFCNNVYVLIDENKKQFMIKDNGRGIPIGKITELVTKIHAGGKFNSDAYKFSSGLNGVGLKLVNAVSKEFIVKVRRDGKEVSTKYSKGELVEELHEIGKSKETGTTIIFTPDIEILRDLSIDIESYMDFCEKSSYLIPNLTIELNVKKQDGNMLSKVYHSDNGLFDYIDLIEKEPILKPFRLDMKKDYKEKLTFNDGPSSQVIERDINTEMDIYITYSKKPGDNIISFVNGVQTKEGGTHETGCKMGMTKVINKYINDNNIKSKRDEKLEITGEDVRDGLVLIINSRISCPEYDSQTKEKVNNTQLMSLGNSIMVEKLTEFFNKNPKEAKMICVNAINSARGRLAAEKAKSVVIKKNESIFSAISSISKFNDCECTDPKLKRLYIVEGDSAGGSVIDAKDVYYDAVYKLKGKPLNAYDNSIDKVMKNKELRDLVTVLGCGIGPTKDISKLNFHTIIILSDSDCDGFDIKSLLDGFFFKYYPEIIENGYLYHAEPPLYGFKDGSEFKYIKDKEAYNNFIKSKIESEFTLGTKREGQSKLVRVKLDKVTETMRKYRLFLNDFASEYGVEESFIERLVLNSNDDKSIKQFCKNNNLDYIDGLIEGMYGDKFVTFYIPSAKVDMTKLKQFYMGMNIWELYYKKNDTKDKFKACTLSEFFNIVDKCTPKSMQRYKGLGEMNADQLFDTTLDVTNENVSLIKITLDDLEASSSEVDIQLGGDADKRKVSMSNFEVDPDDLEK